MLINTASATSVATNVPGSPYLRTADAARYLGLGRSTLERMRIRGDGPAFRRLGTRVVAYAVSDLDAFASRQVRTSTSQAA
jgi:predicted DNA-binding transcriptional regulator AlpA